MRFATHALVGALVAGLAVGCPTAARGQTMPAPPLQLPRAAVASAGIADRWIIAGYDEPAVRVVARRFGARRLRLPGVYTVPRAAARSFARELRQRNLLRFAERDRRFRRSSAVDGDPVGWGRGAVTALPGLPGPTALSGVLDSVADLTHPDLAGHVSALNLQGVPVTNPHGTMVASVISGSANTSGTLGVLPGAPVVSYGLPELACSAIVDGISALVNAKVRVINASFGGDQPCYAMYAAIMLAVARDVVFVAAAGNEYEDGNPTEYPASYPHVLSAAAVASDLTPASFSNSSAAVDLAAPGVAVPVAVPVGLDTEDGTPDGVSTADGTSFAAPIVSAVAAAVLGARPGLTSGQASDVLRFSARDIFKPGFDADTGFGLVQLEAALAEPTPELDPLEPNDDIAHVDGTLFASPDRPIWRGQGARLVDASVDATEDPFDVYRLRMPGKSRMEVTVRPARPSGDPDVALFRSTATTVTRSRGLIGAGVRAAGRTERLLIINPASESRLVYAAVTVPSDASTLNPAYQLGVRRLRWR